MRANQSIIKNKLNNRFLPCGGGKRYVGHAQAVFIDFEPPRSHDDTFNGDVTKQCLN